MTDFQQTLATITDYIKADIFPGASLALYDGKAWQEYYQGTQAVSYTHLTLPTKLEV